MTGGPGGTFAPLIPEVDVYDFTTASWTRLAAASNLPTPRAASALVALERALKVDGAHAGRALLQHFGRLCCAPLIECRGDTAVMQGEDRCG